MKDKALNKTGAKILLLTVFAARGTSFIFTKTLLTSMSPMSILGIRFILAFLVLAVIFGKKLLSCNSDSLKGGLLLGVLYTLTMVFETYGLRSIDSGVSSLIDNMAIVLVPVYTAIYTRKLPKKKTVLCSVMAVTGVGFLSLTQQGKAGAAMGIFLTICAALTYAFCIIATAYVSKKGDPVTIGMLQLGTMGVISLVVSLISGDFEMPSGGNQWLMLLALILVCSCFGFTFQPVGQKHLPAETAAMFSVVNPLTATLLGIVAAKESCTVLKLVGFVFIITSLVLYNIDFEKSKNQKVKQTDDFGCPVKDE